jgi:hypothetical protein
MITHQKINLVFSHKYETEPAVAKFLSSIGYSDIKKTNPHICTGIPDFICNHNNSEKYIELKCNGQKLSKSQQNWLKNNSDKEVIILHASIDYEDSCYGDYNSLNVYESEKVKKKGVFILFSHNEKKYFKDNAINAGDWLHNVISKAILLRKKNKNFMCILDREIQDEEHK